MARGPGGSEGGTAWEEVEIGERRVLPALPGQDPELGEIRWDRWERALVLTHIDPSCGTCGYAGPLAVAKGRTWYTPEPSWVRVRRSSWERGERSKWAKAQHRSYWCYTHWATRCQACDEMVVWLISGGGARCLECGAVSPDRLKGERGQCPACLRDAWHRVPRSGDTRTWVEVAYNPPTAQRVPPRAKSRGGGPQEEVLF